MPGSTPTWTSSKSECSNRPELQMTDDRCDSQAASARQSGLAGVIPFGLLRIIPTPEPIEENAHRAL